MRVSVIVPVFDEAPTLAALAKQVLALQQQGAQVLLVDGGSADGTVVRAEQMGLPVRQAQRGRALQMNDGAAHSNGELLLFLHADTRLPDSALKLLQAALRGPHVWGRFDVRIDGRPALLRVVAWLMNWRSRLTGIATGDQAIFMTRAAFDAVGGYPPQPLMEDVEMSTRLKRLGPPACLRQRVVTSGRRWERGGVWRTIFLMWRLRWAYWRGVPASTLARAYR